MFGNIFFCLGSNLNFYMKIFVYFVFIFFFVFNCSYINAQPIGQITGYKLPRYVSLKSNESNLRVGASKDYPILLTYVIENFPVEIINEYKQPLFFYRL